jgi:hypothetical protein
LAEGMMDIRLMTACQDKHAGLLFLVNNALNLRQ